MLGLLLLLQTKHLIVDWFWQPPYEFLNKGTYGHWGGIRHALKHAIGTAICLFCISFLRPVYPLIIILSLFDFLVHYHIDWAKMNLNRLLKVGPNDARFWALVGIDQYLHQITYLLITLAVAVIFSDMLFKML